MCAIRKGSAGENLRALLDLQYMVIELRTTTALLSFFILKAQSQVLCTTSVQREDLSEKRAGFNLQEFVEAHHMVKVSSVVPLLRSCLL